jgi:alpha-aminoadipate carrier protein LysW
MLPPHTFSEEEAAMALCTECEAEITLESSTEVGEIIQCPDCGLDLEVISVEPAELAPAPEEEEDWGE